MNLAIKCNNEKECFITLSLLSISKRISITTLPNYFGYGVEYIYICITDSNACFVYTARDYEDYDYFKNTYRRFLILDFNFYVLIKLLANDK